MDATEFLLKWDQAGQHKYESGVDHAVFYPYGTKEAPYSNGETWNGVTAINENPSGAEASPIYADNIKYLNLMSAETYACTIEALTYPDSFEECDGTVAVATGVTVGQQPRKTFGLSYRTKVGNDAEGQDAGYKLHLVYGCLASPSEKNHSTINESPETANFSWSVNTTPVDVPGAAPSSTVTIDSTKLDTAGKAKLAQLEKILYGTPAVEADPENSVEAAAAVPARLPLPAEIMKLFGTEG
jgi:hypothetical protein